MLIILSAFIVGVVVGEIGLLAVLALCRAAATDAEKKGCYYE